MATGVDRADRRWAPARTAAVPATPAATRGAGAWLDARRAGRLAGALRRLGEIRGLVLAPPGDGRPDAPLAASDPAEPAPATVLLIDDEKVRRALAQSLRHCGYRVLEAADGEEGLEVHARHRREIAVVVVDQRMPPRLITGTVRLSSRPHTFAADPPWASSRSPR